jgi:NADPH-dependent 7-cyano-7-deazaguanine reductase QueF
MAVDVFENPYQNRDYKVTIRWPESEDFAEVNESSLPGVLFIEYIPDRYCLNRESLGNYLEDLVEADFLDQKTLNLLLTDLVNSSKPRQMDISYAPESDRSSKTVISRSYRRSDIRVEE